MTEDSQPDKMLFRDFEATYFGAQLHFREFVSLHTHLTDPNRGEMSQDELDRAFQVRRAAMLGTIAFSAITLEGAINLFGYSKKVPYYSHVEQNMSPLNKWRLFPRLVDKSPLKEDLLDRVQLTFHLRDRVVHPKPRQTELGVEKRVFMLQEAAYLLNTMDLALIAIDMGLPDDSRRFYEGHLPHESRPSKDIWFL